MRIIINKFNSKRCYQTDLRFGLAELKTTSAGLPFELLKVAS
jgi:hypothetical protein